MVLSSVAGTFRFSGPGARWVLAFVLALLAGCSASRAQNRDACLDVAVQRFDVDRARAKVAPCRTLDVLIEDSISTYLDEAARQARRSADEAIQNRLSPRDFQIPQGQVGNDAGTSTQGGAAPSIQSVALAGGNVATVGTEKGTRALATAAINPASLFGGPDGTPGGDSSNRKDSLSVALSNLGDVTFIAPLQDVDRDEGLDYLGVRARFNVTALTQGTKAFRQVEQQWQNTLQLSGQLTQQIVSAVEQASDVDACAQALLRAPEAGLSTANEACNTDLSSLALTQQDFATLRALTQQALADADDAYFGLDLRFDAGDPTLGVADSARGTRLYAGFGWGRRYGEATSARATIRLHGGVRYVDLNRRENAAFAAEGGADLGFSKVVDRQRLAGSVGLSFSAADVGEGFEAAAETNYLRGRFSVSVPLAENYGLSINFATPIIGDVGTTLSVKTNWHLLLPGSN